MRGKRRIEGYVRVVFRNIPAYAGKTEGATRFTLTDEEHPRVCGENMACSLVLGLIGGTSPRMRGKRGVTGGINVGCRNIPAYAGKTR